MNAYRVKNVPNLNLDHPASPARVVSRRLGDSTCIHEKEARPADECETSDHVEDASDEIITLEEHVDARARFTARLARGLDDRKLGNGARARESDVWACRVTCGQKGINFGSD
jgi:hypothetical protein